MTYETISSKILRLISIPFTVLGLVFFGLSMFFGAIGTSLGGIEGDESYNDI